MSTAGHVQIPIASSASPQHHHDHHDVARAPQRRSWTVLAVALVAQVLVVLDISVVNTALPTIGAELHLAGVDLCGHPPASGEGGLNPSRKPFGLRNPTRLMPDRADRVTRWPRRLTRGCPLVCRR
jgi:hypothetical protein